MNPNAPLMKVIDSLNLPQEYQPDIQPTFRQDYQEVEEFHDIPPPGLIDELAPSQVDYFNGQDLMMVPQQPVEFELTPERKELLHKITMYRYSRFYTRIIEVYPTIFDDLSKRPDDEILKDLELIKSYIQQRRSGDHFREQFKNSLVIVDKLASFLDMDTEGASDVLINDDEILDTLEEVRLKHELNVSPEPEYLLATSVLSVYLKVSAKNQLKKLAKDKEVLEGIKKQLEISNPKLESDFDDI